MKHILCFGDSNTWGFDPQAFARFPLELRWTGVLRQALGEGYHIIEEGLGGRTTVWEDPIENKMSGKQYLVPCLDSHEPLDLVIIMLGTNDLKKRFSVNATDIANSVKTLVDIVFARFPGQRPDGRPQTEVLVLAPPPIVEVGVFAEMFEGGAEKSKQFPQAFASIPQRTKAHLLDTSLLITSSPIDGIHFDQAAHQVLGEAVARKVEELLEQ